MKRIPKSVLAAEEQPLRHVGPETWEQDEDDDVGDLIKGLFGGTAVVLIGILLLVLARFFAG